MLKLQGAKILDVGTAGDPPRPDGKPGGNYPYFGEGNTYATCDVTAEFNPDYVEDICKTSFKDGTWDLVILSQTLEHIYTPHEAIEEVYRILKNGGHAIIDSPWMYPYHAEYNYDDYFRYSMTALQKMCEEAGFSVVESSQTDVLSSVLVKK